MWDANGSPIHMTFEEVIEKIEKKIQEKCEKGLTEAAYDHPRHDSVEGTVESLNRLKRDLHFFRLGTIKEIPSEWLDFI